MGLRGGNDDGWGPSEWKAFATCKSDPRFDLPAIHVSRRYEAEPFFMLLASRIAWAIGVPVPEDFKVFTTDR